MPASQQRPPRTTVLHPAYRSGEGIVRARPRRPATPIGPAAARAAPRRGAGGLGGHVLAVAAVAMLGACAVSKWGYSWSPSAYCTDNAGSTLFTAERI